MSRTEMYWQALLLIATIVICAETFLFDSSTPKYLREVRLPLVNALLCIATFTGGINLLGWLVQSTASFSVFGIVAAVSLYAALFIMIWLAPSEGAQKSESSTPENQVHKESEQETKQRQRQKQRESASRELLRHRIAAIKTLCSLMVLLVPVILVVHVQKNYDFYFSNLENYQQLRVKDLPPERARATEAPSGRLKQYLEAIDLHFISTPKLHCSQNDATCASVQNLIESVQNNRGIFMLKVFYYFLCFYLILRYYGKVAQIHFHHRPKDPESLGLQNDVVKQCSEIIAVSAAFLSALIVAGVDFTSLGIFGGLIGAGLSVALKDLLGNVVAGVLLLWDKTIKKDDVITVAPSASSDTGSTYAIVKKMTLRYTVVQDRNDVRRLIPNSFLTNSIVENWTHEDKMVRLRVVVGVDYNTDLRLARTILEAACYEVPRIETRDNPPKAVITGFGENSINLALRFYIKDAHKGIRPVISDLYIGIFERFRKEGIKIPYPRRDLRLVGFDGKYALPEVGSEQLAEVPETG